MIGRTIDRYRVIEELGRGGSEIYTAMLDGR
jgi:hypothetical protein